MLHKLDYVVPPSRAVSPLAIAATIANGFSTLLFAYAVADNNVETAYLAWISIPVALIGTAITLIAISRRRSRGRIATMAALVALAYWSLFATVLGPKLAWLFASLMKNMRTGHWVYANN